MPDAPNPTQIVAPIADQGWLRRLLIFALIAAVLLAASRLTPFGERFTEAQLTDALERAGSWGPVAIVGVGLFAPLLFLPRWPIAVVAGLLYGLGWGSLLANTASTLGAWLHFGLARGLLFPAAERIRRRYGLRAAEQLQDRSVFLALLLLRAFPLSNFVATNLLAGALKIKPRLYISATFLGMIPSTLMYAALGKAVKTQAGRPYLVLAGSLLLLLSAGAWLASRHLRRSLAPAAGSTRTPKS